MSFAEGNLRVGSPRSPTGIRAPPRVESATVSAILGVRPSPDPDKTHSASANKTHTSNNPITSQIKNRSQVMHRQPSHQQHAENHAKHRKHRPPRHPEPTPPFRVCSSAAPARPIAHQHKRKQRPDIRQLRQRPHIEQPRRNRHQQPPQTRLRSPASETSDAPSRKRIRQQPVAAHRKPHPRLPVAETPGSS